MENLLKKFAYQNLQTIVSALPLNEAQGEALLKQPSDLAALNHLLEAQAFLPAIKLLALGLPKRESVWWAYLCAFDAEGSSNCLKTQSALRASSLWVHDPSEANREKAHTAAESLELYTASSWAAMAAFWSGDNIAPKDRPAVCPSPFMAGEAVFNAVTIAANAHTEVINTYKNYLRRALHIAMGGSGRI